MWRSLPVIAQYRACTAWAQHQLPKTPAELHPLVDEAFSDDEAHPPSETLLDALRKKAGSDTEKMEEMMVGIAKAIALLAALSGLALFLIAYFISPFGALEAFVGTAVYSTSFYFIVSGTVLWRLRTISLLLLDNQQMVSPISEGLWNRLWGEMNQSEEKGLAHISRVKAYLDDVKALARPITLFEYFYLMEKVSAPEPG